MPHPSSIFFSPEALLHAFEQDLARAVLDQRLTPDERAWLSDNASSATPAARVDVLSQEGETLPDPCLTGTMLISHPDRLDAPVYLTSPLFGVERFTHRQALSDTLKQRIAREEVIFDGTLSDGQWPVQQSQAYLATRAERLHSLALLVSNQPLLRQGATGLSAQAQVDAYWQRLDRPSGTDRRDLAARALAEGVYQDALQHSANPSTGWLQALAHWRQTQSAGRVLTVQARQGDTDLPLPGAFVVQGLGSELLLWWPGIGLVECADRQALDAYLDGLDKAPLCLAAADQVHWQPNAARHYQLAPIERPLWRHCVDALLALQQRNLEHAALEPLQTETGLNMALRITALIDRRAAGLDPIGRWSDARFTGGATPVHAPSEVQPDIAAAHQVRTLRAERHRLEKARPGATTCLTRILAPWLAVHDPALDLHRLRVESAAEPLPGTWASLARYCMAQITAHTPGPSATGARVVDGATAASTAISPTALAQMGRWVSAQFTDRYRQQWAHVTDNGLRINGEWIQPGSVMGRNTADALRIEVALARRQARIDVDLLDVLQHHLTRDPVQTAPTDTATVCGLQLLYLANHPGVHFRSALLVKSEDNDTSKVLLWTPHTGLQAFASMVVLRHEFNGVFADPTRNQGWLGLLDAADRAAIEQRQQALPALPLDLHLDTWPVQADLGETLAKGLLDQQQAAALATQQRAIRDHYRGDLALLSMDQASTGDAVADGFEGLIAQLTHQSLKSFLPDWLINAGRERIRALIELLNGVIVWSSPDHFYLEGVPDLNAYARSMLIERLGKDFNLTHVADPDQIIIELRTYVAAPVTPGETPSGIPAATTVRRQSLTRCALDHFSALRNAQLSVVSGAGELKAALTPQYLSDMVDSLDVGAHYQTVLQTRLSPSAIDYPERRHRYGALLTVQVLLVGMLHLLQGRLSARAFECLRSVLQMPDGLARLTVDGQRITFTPLRIKASVYRAADIAHGMYVITPQATEQGPTLLLSIQAPENGLFEFADRDALMRAIRDDPAVRDLVLQRLDDQARPIYDHGGFSEPHMTWSVESDFDLPSWTPTPAQLDLDPDQGNARHRLYADNIELLQNMAKLQSVSSAQARWDDFRYLTTLGAEQGATFLPGKLAILVNLWQGKTWIEAGSTAVRNRQWGQAVSEFSAALATLVTTPSDSPVRARPSVREPVGAVPAFSWRHGHLSPHVQARLQAYAARDVALVDLEPDPDTGLYQLDDRYYAAVAGSVYQVRSNGSGWSIVGPDARTGPKIRRNAQHEWELDLQWGLKGGGYARDYDTEQADQQVASVFTVQARGMKEIRAADRIKARQITAAHLAAQKYLEVALANLNSTRIDALLPVRAEQLIGQVLGIPAVTVELRSRITESITDIYSELLQPSLSPTTSMRFVTGTNKSPTQWVDAFTMRADPQRRIFLTENYFRAPGSILQLDLRSHGNFDPLTHFQATTLIHEISHLQNLTADIAYIDAAGPFPDLLSADDQDMYLRLLDAQGNGLSVTTPPQRLFKICDNGNWRDLSDDDGWGLRTILKITGKRSLEEARAVFYEDAAVRCEIILSNADSIAYLATRLGRERFDQIGVA